MLEVLMIVYQCALVFFDFLHLLAICTWLTLVAIYRLLFSVERKSIAGQLALVTGSGHGIGKELALQLSRLGAKVVCCDINEEWNKKTVEAIKGEAGVAWAYTCDVSSKDNVNKVMQMIRREVGDIDILFNNAGIMPCKPFLKHSSEEVLKIFNINVYAHFWTLQEWLPVFMSRGHGHIVATSSIAGVAGVKNLVPYCASKHAVKGLMEGLKEELRFDNQYPNIKLTSVHPFIVDTGLAQKPMIRFPSITPITSPAAAAGSIIDGMRKEDFMVNIPSKDFYLMKGLSLVPLAVQHAVVDFLDANLDEHDD